MVLSDAFHNGEGLRQAAPPFLLAPVAPHFQTVSCLIGEVSAGATESDVLARHVGIVKKSIPWSTQMTIQFSTAKEPRHLRLSLKRGLARQAVSKAQKAQADDAAIFSELRSVSPNRRSMERSVLRLRKSHGVVRAGIFNGRMIVVFRHACAIFSENALIYTRVSVFAGKGKLGMWINRVSFNQHALERLIERSRCRIRPDFLSSVDAEAAAALKLAQDGEWIEDDGDDYIPSRENGVWAGSLDFSSPDPEWGLQKAGAQIPVFSARTFLGPEEMKPSVWLRWQDDPCLSFVA
jgi:hypothetical protein